MTGSQETVEQRLDLPATRPVRRFAIRRYTSDCGIKACKRVHSFDREVRAKRNSCATVDKGAKCIQSLHTFGTLKSAKHLSNVTGKCIPSAH
jgi:hypothetical protein